VGCIADNQIDEYRAGLTAAGLMDVKSSTAGPTEYYAWSESGCCSPARRIHKFAAGCARCAFRRKLVDSAIWLHCGDFNVNDHAAA
jgi:hypothetical protein